MKKVIRVLLITTFAIAIFIVAVILILFDFTSPLSRSNERIRADMLQLTPIGTSMDDVIRVIESNEDWTIYQIYNRGYSYSLIRGNPSRGRECTVIGEKSFEVHLGGYYGFLWTDVTVFYGFDDNSMLIDVAVLKEKDGL